MSELENTAIDTTRTLTARIAGGPPGMMTRQARKAIFQQISRIRAGYFTITDFAGATRFGTDGSSPHRAEIVIHDASLYSDIVARGMIGVAEGFMNGKWTTPDLTAAIRLLLANRDVLDDIDALRSSLTRWAFRASHWLHRNHRSQSRRNISAHYDIGNDLFRLFLDPTMMYSSAVFPHEDASLEEASLHKLDLICRKLELQPGDHLLEIGTGWGGLALHAARKFGCRVTTTTISREQYNLARRRVAEAGLGDRVTVLDRDYRDLTGQYDKLVSVEMIEAVGPEFLDGYFRVCSERLKPNGRLLLQAIVMSEERYMPYSRSVDFIKKYIFPGGALPALSLIQDSTHRMTDMRIVHLHDIGLHYARTLRAWYDRFSARRDEVRKLGYTEEFIRMWQYYFCYCEGGFLEQTISNVQVVFDKPDCRLPLPDASSAHRP